MKRNRQDRPGTKVQKSRKSTIPARNGVRVPSDLKSNQRIVERCFGIRRIARRKGLRSAGSSEKIRTEPWLKASYHDPPTNPSDFHSNLAKYPTVTSLLFCPQLSRFSIPTIQHSSRTRPTVTITSMCPKQLSRWMPWRLRSGSASSEAGTAQAAQSDRQVPNRNHAPSAADWLSRAELPTGVRGQCVGRVPTAFGTVSGASWAALGSDGAEFQTTLGEG